MSIHGVNMSPDTMVLLRDKSDGTTICVASAHLRGFGLDYGTMEAGPRAAELNQAKLGDDQLRYELETMKLVPADLYVVAGDFNVTQQHYPARLAILEARGFVTDKTDVNPTIFDANLKDANQEPERVKLDYVYAKRGDGGFVMMCKESLPGSLDRLDRPSDHLPAAASILFSKA